MRARYLVSYLLTVKNGGRAKRFKKIEFTKKVDDWNVEDYRKLSVFLSRQEGNGCDVAIIDVAPLEGIGDEEI